MPEPIIVTNYDPNWPALFEQIKAPIQQALEDIAAAIDHVGSTSVPGLAAKPIIDIDVALARAADLPRAIEILASLGYSHEGDLGITGREAFRQPPGSPDHHLYIVLDGNDPHRHHLLLRDRLRRDAAARREYGELKRGLAVLYADNREGYTVAKTEFIEKLLAEEQNQL